MRCQVTATDADAGDNARIRYVIPGHVTSMFHVDQRGVVSSLSSIDREQYDGFRFPVVAVDAGSPSRTGTAPLPGTSRSALVLWHAMFHRTMSSVSALAMTRHGPAQFLTLDEASQAKYFLNE